MACYHSIMIKAQALASLAAIPPIPPKDLADPDPLEIALIRAPGAAEESEARQGRESPRGIGVNISSAMERAKPPARG